MRRLRITPFDSLRSLRVRVIALCLLGAGCNGGGAGSSGSRAVFAIDSAHDTPETFWDHPFPSDSRLTAEGAPDMTGFFTNGAGSLGTQIVESVVYRTGWAQMPVGYFRFTRPLAERIETDTVAALPTSPFLLVDVDAASTERGKLFPVVAKTLEVDVFAPEHLLAVSAKPGIILRAQTTYAIVVLASANDARGKSLRPARAIETLAAGETPSGTNGAAMAALYAPLWTTLDTIGVPRGDVVHATVFTTGNVVAELAAMTDGLLAQHSATIANPVIDPIDGVHPEFCEVKIDLTLPQFVTGTEPWNTGGRFVLDSAGLPVKQSDRTMTAVLTIPRAPMPANGFPLLLYFHGSGGVHDQVVDASRSPAAGVDGPPGEGPAMFYARQGIAAAGAPLPVSPDRVPGATEIAYINFSNLGNFTFLFRQGVIEQRMFTSALLDYHMPPAVLSSCSGVTTPTDIFFDADNFYAGGQSQGGMYTNLFGAVDPRPKAFVPTGAGGLWALMILTGGNFTSVVEILGPTLGTSKDLTFLHPGLHALELAWETAEPLVFAPHLARRPLPGYPARPIYEPVGMNDGYFETPIYDAIALAYGHEQAGDAVWSSLQSSLALEGFDGIVAYPVTNNVLSENGESYTGVVVQYEGDGIVDPHAIYRQRDEVIHQYSCFLRSMIDTGVGVVPAPAALGTTCP